MRMLFIVLPATLLAFGTASASQPRQHSRMSSGRSVSHDVRAAWFRHSVGDILVGHVTGPAKRAVAR